MLFEQSNEIEKRVIVVNKYKVKSRYIDITRGHSVLCNPSVVGERSREQALNDFQQHMSEQLRVRPKSEFLLEMERILQLLFAGQIVRLGCVCKPKSCHGDLIRAKLISEYKRRELRSEKKNLR